jgi:endonuclease YncB( thermonuclease family)
MRLLNSPLAGAFALKWLFDRAQPSRSSDAEGAEGPDEGESASGRGRKGRRSSVPFPAGELPPGTLLFDADQLRVIDGDTVAAKPGVYALRDGGTWEAREGFRIRLNSVAAPETWKDARLKAGEPLKDIWKEDADAELAARFPGHQGLIAKKALSAVLQNRRVEVTPQGVDQYGRLLGDLEAEPGFSVGRLLIEMGVATTIPGEEPPAHREVPPQVHPSDYGVASGPMDPFEGFGLSRPPAAGPTDWAAFRMLERAASGAEPAAGPRDPFRGLQDDRETAAGPADDLGPEFD